MTSPRRVETGFDGVEHGPVVVPTGPHRVKWGPDRVETPLLVVETGFIARGSSPVGVETASCAWGTRSPRARPPLHALETGSLGLETGSLAMETSLLRVETVSLAAGTGSSVQGYGPRRVEPPSLRDWTPFRAAETASRAIEGGSLRARSALLPVTPGLLDAGGTSRGRGSDVRPLGPRTATVNGPEGVRWSRFLSRSELALT